MKGIYYINNFRALAIISIVLGHCIGFCFNTNKSSTFYYENILFNFLQGGTYYFVFITGYLTPKVFYNHYSFKEFFFKKSLKLLTPYLVISSPVILLYLIFNKGTYKEENVLIQLIYYFLSGQTFYAYWYIPFVILLFSLYPLLKFLDKMPRYLFISFSLLSLIAIFMQRPIDNINTFQSLIYFLPVYLFGNIFFRYENYFINNFCYFAPLSFLFFLFFLFLQSFLSNNIGSFHSKPFNYNGIDYMYLQKLSLIIFLMLTFIKYLDYKFYFLDLIAKNSFGIFFAHMPVI